MGQVSINPELLRWARERVDETIDTLRKPFPKYSAWEAGEARPTLRQLERFAKRTRTPLGYFFLSAPPEEPLPIPDFREGPEGGTRAPSPELLDTLYAMQERQDWMRDFLLEQGAEPVGFARATALTEKPCAAAMKLRGVLGLAEDWAAALRTWEDAFKELRQRADAAGVLVVCNGVVGNNAKRILSVSEFRGFALCDEYAPLIFVNGADAKAAQIFTLVHELNHIGLGRAGVSKPDHLSPAENEIESFCNETAAEFLVSETVLRAVWPKAADEEEPIQAMARRFKVSAIVAARRALDLGLITRRAFFDFHAAYEKDERRKKVKPSGGNFYGNQTNRVGRRFAEAVYYAAKEGRLLYRDAYRLTGLSGESFVNYAKHLGLEV